MLRPREVENLPTSRHSLRAEACDLLPGSDDMSDKKPDPIIPLSVPKRCPVCGKASYSRSGTHPQCAVSRADAVLKAARKATEAVAEPKPPRPPGTKQCPRCQRRIPARRMVCDCGHSFNPKVIGPDHSSGAAILPVSFAQD
jgi:hypothetical protein